MEDVLGTIHELNLMALQANAELIWFARSHRYGYAPVTQENLVRVVHLREFIADCQRFQMDLLRPWERTD